MPSVEPPSQIIANTNGKSDCHLLCSLDNLWNDQNTEGEIDLPSGWRKIHDSSGTYYWHVPTGTTQWQHPSRTSGLGHAGEAAFPETVFFDILSLCVMPIDVLSLPLCLSASLCLPPLFSQCFVVRSLGWVEIPEEDLAPGKSSIAVNNCIQQLSQSNCDNFGPADRWGEGQNMVMILKEDTMNLVDPLDHSLIHCQPIINIRVWGVGCNKGRDFAFVASDKDTCVLKCHVFHCNVPGKAIAKALHEMCSKVSLLTCSTQKHTYIKTSPVTMAGKGARNNSRILAWHLSPSFLLSLNLTCYCIRYKLSVAMSGSSGRVYSLATYWLLYKCLQPASFYCSSEWLQTVYVVGSLVLPELSCLLQTFHYPTAMFPPK
uniref:Amyloid beta protein binding family B member 3 n=1 Tax=Naja naja TaxID=35670 RepID=A0A8C6X6Q6_NAJNA